MAVVLVVEALASTSVESFAVLLRVGYFEVMLEE